MRVVAFEELGAEYDFLRGCGAAKQQAVGLLDAGCLIVSAADALSQCFCLLDHQWAIQEKEPLQRHCGFDALFTGSVRIREVEQGQKRVQIFAAYEAVNRAALVFCCELLRRAACGCVQLAGDEEKRVTQFFHIETLAVGAPEQAIFWIGREGFWVIASAELIGGGQHDLTVDCLDGPFVFDEAGGQVIKKLGVDGALA